MELRHLRYFLAVADAMHFRRAAESLRIAQPTLSQQIQQLEKELATALFERIGKRVRLTTAGESFRHHAQRVLHELDQARVALDELDGLRRGKLLVGVVQTLGTYLVPSILARFTSAHPGVFVSVAELTAGQIEEELLNGGLNLGISYLSSTSREIASVPLFKDELVVIASVRHRLAKRKKMRLSELDQESLILLPATYWIRAWLDEMMRTVGIRPRVAVEMNSIAGILATVRSCGGATVLPALTLKNQATGLQSIRLTDPALPHTLGLLWRQAGYRCKAADVFIRFAHAVSEEIAR